MSRIEKAFAQAHAERRAAFVGYLCAGDPDFEISISACRALIESGVDILELGVPFSDPLADGLTNQLAAQRALEGGCNSQKVLELVRAVRKFSQVPIVFYTYYNLVFAQGSEAYLSSVKAAGVDGLLTLDLPPEEAADYLALCQKYDVKTVFIAAPTTPDSRLETICKVATGFIYYVSREGVTGEQTKLSDGIKARVDIIKKYTELPVVVGFGISNAGHVSTVAQAADGVVVGSALVNCIANNLGNAELIDQSLRSKMRDLTQGNSLNQLA